jgi:hypothetical protein
MKTNKELLLDIIILKKKKMNKLADELSNSLNEVNVNNYIYACELSQKKESVEFLDSLITLVKKDNGFEYLKRYLKENQINNNTHKYT